MKAVVASGFGKPDAVLSLADVPPPPAAPTGHSLLVRVVAASLTPGDYRMLLGDASAVKKPAAGFPYTVGGDVAGEVLAVGTSKAAAAFAVGDRVVATWSGVCGEGAMAEKALVDARVAVPLPAAVGFREGAALVNSACHAVQAVEAAPVRAGDRVLVLGGSGGVGSLVVQLARRAGAAYVAATSTQGEMLRGLGVDRVVDYREEDWAAVAEFRAERFDVVIDCAVGRAAWENPGLGSVVKNGKEGGRFVAVVGDDWYVEVKSLLQMPGVLGPGFMRQLRSSWSGGKVPRYRFFLGSTPRETIAEVMRMAADGEIRAVLDARSPLPFGEQGVKDAFNIMISRRAHGKIVVEM